jgi:membrane associated rhomboid family serine protease
MLLDDRFIMYSGEGLERGRWWTVLTASLDHYDSTHVLVNMAHLACMGAALDATLGRFGTVLSFFGAGCSGWAFSYALARLKHAPKGEWSGPENWVSFQQSHGASPATYGLNALLVALAPSAATTQIGGVLPPWASLWLVCCAPALFARAGLGVQWRASASATGCGAIGLPWLSHRAALYAAATFVAARSAGARRGGACACTALSARALWAAYLAQGLAWKAIRTMWCGEPFIATQSDNACHLGGALFGVVVGLALLRRRGCVDAATAAAPRGRRTLACSIAYLVARWGVGF